MDLRPFLVTAFVVCAGVCAGMLDSPCPDVFRYEFDDSDVLYGFIQVDCPDDNVIQLNVEISLGNKVDGYNGRIELAYSRMRAVENVLNRRPLSYKLFFPAWTQVLPRVTRILINGQLVCAGPSVDKTTVPILTMINLQHTFKINIPPNMILSLPERPIRPRHSTETGPMWDLDSDDATQKPLSIPLQNIDFNPTMPKDPSKIFPGNPFLSRLPTRPPTRPPTTQRPTMPTMPTMPPTRTTTEPSVVMFEVPVFANRQPEVEQKAPQSDVCGMSIAANSLIANGSPVVRGTYPWVAAIFVQKPLGLEFRCSGSLISKRHIVTAAHCMKQGSRKLTPEQILLVLGKNNIQKWTRVKGEVIIEADSIHMHPEYEMMSGDADIAVITLGEEVEFSKYIRPICLWGGDTDLNDIVAQKGTVVGWGRDEDGHTVTAEQKLATLPVVSQEDCLRSMYSFQYITSNRTFCAGSRDGSGPCNGDSGGGFIMLRNGRWTLRGIVSLSLPDPITKSCDLKQYIVFNDASKFTDWIMSLVNKK